MSKFKELFDKFKNDEIKHKKLIIATVALVVVIPIIIVPVVIILVNKNSYDNYYTKGAIVSNAVPCSEIGIKILRKYENVIDAIIATLLCDGVTTLGTLGIGGGFMALIYIKNEEKVYALNARETAPFAATPNTIKDKGVLSAGVPGQLMGYDAMYKLLGGSAPWKELFAPTIELCRNGIPINARTAWHLYIIRKIVLKDKSFSSIYVKEDGTIVEEGDKVKMPQLASTLEIIADEGVSAFYNGSLSNLFINDIKAKKGIITLKDLSSYRIHWEEPVTADISGGYRMYTTPAPSSGDVFSFLLKVLDGIIPLTTDETDVGIITEAFKYAFGFRSHMGDPYYENMTDILNTIHDPNTIKNIKKKLNIQKTSLNPKDYGFDSSVDDHGTANIVALAPNGDTIVVTSSLNYIFGSYYISPSTGILLNSHMADFSLQGSSNLVKPGARPLSGMCPAVFIKKNGDVRLAIGAAGGQQILTAQILVAIDNLWKDQDIFESVKKPRYHTKLSPMKWLYDGGTDEDIVEYMKRLGHIVQPNDALSVVTAISQIGKSIKAADDVRRVGSISYFIPRN